MSRYLVLKDFKGAIRGVHVRAFSVGATVVIEDPDLVAVALFEGWVTPVDDLSGAPEGDTPPAPPQAGGMKAAPKNKASKAAPKVKAE